MPAISSSERPRSASEKGVIAGSIRLGTGQRQRPADVPTRGSSLGLFERERRHIDVQAKVIIGNIGCGRRGRQRGRINRQQAGQEIVAASRTARAGAGRAAAAQSAAVAATAVPTGVIASIGRVAAICSCCSAARRLRQASASHSSIAGCSSLPGGNVSNRARATP